MDELQRKFEAALARIAALESQSRTPKTPEFDPRQFAQGFINDPVGTMTKLGIPVDHVSKVLVAHAMGDQAPEPLRMLAQMGPQVSAVQGLSSDLQAVRQRLEQFEEKERKAALRSSFSALSVDKSKYPFLAAMSAKSPAQIESELDAHKGDAAALADALEGRFKAIADAAGYTPPASSGNADTAGQSTQTKAQPGGLVDQTPPPIPQQKAGVFTQETHEALKERILRKYPEQR